MSAAMTDDERLTDRTQRMALQAASILERIAKMLAGEPHALAAAAAAELAESAAELSDVIGDKGAGE